MTLDEQRVDELLVAADGSGPLLQRDYWGTIKASRSGPAEVARLVAARFGEFAPEYLVRFRRAAAGNEELQEGDELEVEIRGVGPCRVRVVHKDANSITLGTLRGHPEAGRITFGAYRDDDGDVVFHIRSRARASSARNYAAYMAGGEAMQTTTWTDFVDRVAHTVGDGIVGSIRAETEVIEELAEDGRSAPAPTYRARGD